MYGVCGTGTKLHYTGALCWYEGFIAAKMVIIIYVHHFFSSAFTFFTETKQFFGLELGRGPPVEYAALTTVKNRDELL